MKQVSLTMVFVLSLLGAGFVGASLGASEPAATAMDKDDASRRALGLSDKTGPPALFLGNQSLPPMNYLKGGKPTGIVVDLATAIAGRMRHPVEIQLMDWGEAQRLVKEDRADALLQINANPERLEIFEFSDPLLLSEFTIFMADDRYGINSMRDLRGLTVGVEEKGLPILLLQEDPEINIKIIPDFVQGFKMLTEGAVDAVIADRWVGSYVLAENNIQHVKMAEEPISSSYSAIAVKKGNAALLADINEALAAIRRDGVYDKILESWRPTEVVFKTREQLRRQRWLWITAGVSLALLVALLGGAMQAREIRRRRRSEDALRNSRAMLNLVLDTVPQSIFWKDREGRYQGCNRAFAAYAGLDDPSKLIGRRDSDLPGLPRVEAEDCGVNEQAVFKRNLPLLHVVKQLQSEEDAPRWIDFSSIPLEQGDGRSPALLGVCEDVTDRKLAEEDRRNYACFLEHLARLDMAIRQAEDVEGMMRDALDVVLDVMKADRAWLVYPFDPETGYWSVPMERTRPEWPGASVLNEQTPLTPELREQWRQFLASDEPVVVGPGGEYPVDRNNKETYSIQSFLAMALHPKTGQRWQFGVHQCSFERVWSAYDKEMLKAMGGRIQDALNSLLFLRDLRESEERFRALVEQAQDAIFVHDESGRILMVNQRACDVLGYSREELLRMTIPDIDPDFLARNDPETIWRSLPGTFEASHKSKDGRFIPVEIRLSRIIYGDRQVLHAAVRDITERKQAEEELHNHREHLEDLVARRTRELEREGLERQLAQEGMRHAKEAAEAASLAKSVFLANMSHELRTPLNSVLGFAQMLRRDPALNEEQNENLDIILRSGEHLLSLINDILDISKIEAGRTKPVNAPFDLWALLDAAVEMMGVRAREKGLQILLERASGLPRYVSADERKLNQVLVNLLGNAVKFTEEGRVILRVEPGAGPDILAFEVEDTGPGIADSVAPSLFERFGQGENDKEGIGLGLYISKKLVEIMGGAISVQSEPGEGSLFAFDIRYAPADSAEVEKPGVSPRVIRLAPGQPAYRILVAEDKEENRLLLVKMLRSAGFEVAEARNGAEAVRLFEENPPDLALMDLRMPVMDGYEAMRRIKAFEKGAVVPILAVTASAFEEDRQKVLAAGADDFIRKPVRPSALFDAIRRWLRVAYVMGEEPAGRIDLPGKDEARRLAASLPDDLAGKLREALDALDLPVFQALLQKVSSHDRRLADGLRRLAQHYEIHILQEIIKPGR